MAKKKEPKIEAKDLAEAIDEIKQRFGEGAIMKLKEVRQAFPFFFDNLFIVAGDIS